MTVPALLNPKMTASWEKGLDGITNGTVDVSEYRAKLEDFIRRETVRIRDMDLTNPLAAKISPFAGKGAKGLGARRAIGAVCPDCGGDMVTTPFGYGCSNYQKDGSGCRFAVGKIAGVDLSEEQVLELLTTKKTGTIRGFKGKSGKRFDACLILERDENDKHVIKFDFTNVEAKKINDVVCPLCGSDVIRTSFGYGCSGYKRGDAEGSCRFSIGSKIAGVKITDKLVKRLLTLKKTDVIQGFTSKSGSKFEAALKLNEDGRVVFDFPGRLERAVKNEQSWQDVEQAEDGYWEALMAGMGK